MHMNFRVCTPLRLRKIWIWWATKCSISRPCYNSTWYVWFFGVACLTTGYSRWKGVWGRVALKTPLSHSLSSSLWPPFQHVSSSLIPLFNKNHKFKFAQNVHSKAWNSAKIKFFKPHFFPKNQFFKPCFFPKKSSLSPSFWYRPVL